ncbi:MAG: hypothetical protein R3C16_06140 [Hyphomonadaceae bacterium]
MPAVQRAAEEEEAAQAEQPRRRRNFSITIGGVSVGANGVNVAVGDVNGDGRSSRGPSRTSGGSATAGPAPLKDRLAQETAGRHAGRRALERIANPNRLSTSMADPAERRDDRIVTAERMPGEAQDRARCGRRALTSSSASPPPKPISKVSVEGGARAAKR